MKSKEFAILMQQLEELKARLEVLRSPTTEEVFLNSDQMERLLKCSPATLYRLRKRGEIPCVLIGRQYRYPKNLFTREMINSIVKREDPSKRFDD